MARLGDWFGATVNRASHIVDIAKPRTIVADAAAREHSTRGLAWKPTRRRSLRGIVARNPPLYRLDLPAGTGS